MKLKEFEGKALLQMYGIATPQSELVNKDTEGISLSYPVVLKSQVPAGDRMAKGGIIVVNKAEELRQNIQALFLHAIDGILPEVVLAEEFIEPVKELYVSFSYSTEHRAPVLALNHKGGSGVHDAVVIPLDILEELADTRCSHALIEAKIAATPELVALLRALWKLFREECVLVAEINPLFLLADGRVIAGDAKVVRDDALTGNFERPFITLPGDIAVIASGGGASMLNIDILMRSGGKPANYVEYSGNPPAALVEELTMQVLAQPNLLGAWVIGGTANFTDIYETMSGFVAGLRRITPKPTYPIVIRRDGPRQEEARAMLMEVVKNEGYNMHVFGSEISMAESAVRLMNLMEKKV
jgi:succinyl-CoA synthetase beta subunit